MNCTRAAVLLWTTACAAPSVTALGQQGAGAEEAQLAFNNHCRTCHVTNADDHRLGPSLHDVVGREAGSASNYAYSSAMADAGLVWDEATLDRFIENPQAVVPGNNMKPYSGIASAEERAKIIAHLKAESGGR
jgi:cytochrome c